ncbi:MAG: hypothetical protein PHU85_08575, partial [Phycisphaerae bacterium]|nr:hypothetical protein [Phycisphaerae bacterium]
EVKFAAAPKAEAAGDKVKISFALSAPSDVEVAVVDGGGKVVRHLAAGLLGKNAPEPFKKDSLAQEIPWDRKDDTGKPAAGGGLKVRVTAGLKPRLDKYAGFDGNCLPGIVGLAVGAGGELFVLMSESFRGGTDMRVLDKNGKYLRTIIPYAANTPKDRMAGVGMLEVEGERLPLIHNALARTNYPLINGMHHQTMAFSPKGCLVMVSAVGTMAEQGSPRYLLALHPEGGAPDGVSFVGPQLRKGSERMLGGAGEGTAGLFDHVAVSPDGEWAYVSVGTYSRYAAKRNGVLRLKWSDKEAGGLWLGKDEPGADDTHFNNPTGLATDKAGNLYVCDWGNNRVMVFSADGKLLGKFPADKPHQVMVHSASGDIYVMSCTIQPKWGRLVGDDSTLRKFAPWGKDEPKEVARLDLRGKNVMTLDPSAAPARLWAGGPGGLCPVLDKGTALEQGERVDNDNSMHHPTYIAGDPARNRALVYENGEVNVYQVDLASGKKSKFCKGTYVTLDRDGNVYVMGGRDNAVYRFDPKGSPLAFSGLGSNKIETKGYRGFGPNMGMPGLCVDVKGNVYVSRNSNYGKADSYGERVDVYGPDGKLAKENILDGLGYGECGLGVDVAGNIYQGMNLKPADKPFPAAFMGKVTAKTWTYWRGPEREAPWCYAYYNPYLWHWGAVFKFPPAGGAVYGQHPWNLKVPAYGEPKPTDKLANAPADAASYRSAYLGYEVKVAGAMWRYPGMGIIPSSGDGLMPDPGCACYNSQLAVDEYGRVFAPNPFRFSVEMLDTNGNQLARIGRYGNVDSAGPGSKLLEPAIAFAGAGYVSVADGKLFVTDTSNHRVVVVAFQPTATADCAAP